MIVKTTLFVEQVTFLLLNKLVSYNKHSYRFQLDIKPCSGHSNGFTQTKLWPAVAQCQAKSLTIFVLRF